jgi:hypothetical protein
MVYVTTRGKQVNRNLLFVWRQRQYFFFFYKRETFYFPNTIFCAHILIFLHKALHFHSMFILVQQWFDKHK